MTEIGEKDLGHAWLFRCRYLRQVSHGFYEAVLFILSE